MRKFVFADEAGDFEFKRKQNVSKYFIICTITLDSCDIGHQLLDLRRELVCAGYPVKDYFHAAEDKQAVRDAVFGKLINSNFTIEATILEKSKAQPKTRVSESRFYQYGWFLHFKGVARHLDGSPDDLLITAASLGTKRTQAAFTAAVNDVVGQHLQKAKWQTHFCPSMADPCLHAVDYCTWAIQRKWEMGDTRSYELIKGKIRHEYESWAHGKTHYY